MNLSPKQIVAELDKYIIGQKFIFSELKMCVSYNDFCSDWEPYNAKKILPTI